MPSLNRLLSSMRSVSSRSSHASDFSYTDTYFEEIGFKVGDNSCLGSTESADNLDGEEILFYNDKRKTLADDDEDGAKSSTIDIDKITSLQEELDEKDILAPVRNNQSLGSPIVEERKKARGPFRMGLFTQLRKAEDNALEESSLAYSVSKSNHQQYGESPTEKKDKGQALDDIRISHTQSTVVEETSSATDKSQSSDSQASIKFIRKKKLILLKFLAGIAICMLIVAIVVLILAMMQYNNKIDDINTAAQEDDDNHWQPSPGWDLQDLPGLDRWPKNPPGFTPVHDELLDILTSVSPSSDETIKKFNSPQYQAFDWLVQSGDLENLSVSRVVQRWVLATMFLSTNGDSWSMNSATRRLANHTDINSTDTNSTNTNNVWMSDTHECSWFSTHADGMCNDSDEIIALSLGHVNVQGTLPTEVGLLSNLKRIYLAGNRIAGTIPSELSQLTKLELLQLSSNQITGSIPKNIGELSNLQALKVHKNKLSGILPFQLGDLEELSTLQVNGNQIHGTIPIELFGMASLETLALESNKFIGLVPTALVSLPYLSSLSIYNNELTGTMPFESCNLSLLSADCDEMICECCTECFVQGQMIQTNPTEAKPKIPTTSPTREPTQKPTRAPTRKPTPSPTREPTRTPTRAPTTTPTIEAGADIPAPFPTRTPTHKPTGAPALTPNTEAGTDIPAPAPTRKPTRRPTPSPTTRKPSPPTPEPSACWSRLSTTKRCFKRGADDIVLQIQDCDETPNAWIGIFPVELFIGGFFSVANDAILTKENASYRTSSFSNGKMTISNAAGLPNGAYLVYLVNNANKRPLSNLSAGQISISNAC